MIVARREMSLQKAPFLFLQLARPTRLINSQCDSKQIATFLRIDSALASDLCEPRCPYPKVAYSCALGRAIRNSIAGRALARLVRVSGAPSNKHFEVCRVSVARQSRTSLEIASCRPVLLAGVCVLRARNAMSVQLAAATEHTEPRTRRARLASCICRVLLVRGSSRESALRGKEM